MNWIRRLGLGWLLIPSLICSGLGLKLVYTAMVSGNRSEGRWGMMFLFGGMTIVPVFLGIVGNLLFRSERSRLKESVRQTRMRSPSIRKLKASLRQIRFIENHPSFVPVFCVMGILVGAYLIVAPADPSSPPHRTVVSQIMGALIGIPYLIVLLLYIYARLTKRWDSYIRKAVFDVENRLAKAQSSAAGGANWESNP